MFNSNFFAHIVAWKKNITQTATIFKNIKDKNLSSLEGDQTNMISLNSRRKPLAGLRCRCKFAWHRVSCYAHRWTLELRRFNRRKQKVKVWVGRKISQSTSGWDMPRLLLDNATYVVSIHFYVMFIIFFQLISKYESCVTKSYSFKLLVLLKGCAYKYSIV